MTFTQNWFKPERFKQHLSKYAELPVTFLEIGAFEGKASCYMLENFLTHKDSKLFCCDTFEGALEHEIKNYDYPAVKERFFENVKSYGSKVTVLIGRSQVMLRSLPADYFDFIYIDGSHYGSDVLEDAILSWRMLRSDGIMAFDDYFWGEGLNSPRKAIDAFIELFKGQYKLLVMSDQVWIQKL